jgi:hypothetical protein
MDIIKKTNALANKVKMTSNLTTLVFVAALAHTISQWHSVMGIDNLINVFIMMLVMVLNIKFYTIYMSLSSIDDQESDIRIKRIYKREKRNYSQQVRIFLWMTIILVIAKLFFS